MIDTSFWIKHFLLDIVCHKALLVYKEIVEVCRKCVINIKFGRKVAVNEKF